jgi:hypothetical protein
MWCGPGRRALVQQAHEAEQSLLTEEVKVGCTLGMLQCLDRSPRMAYVVDELVELPGPEAADALGISPALFRKRLQRARSHRVVHAHELRLASDSLCPKRVPAALRLGRIRKGAPDFAHRGVSYRETRALVRQVEGARWAMQVHRCSNPRASAVDFARRVVSSLGGVQ